MNNVVSPGTIRKTIGDRKPRVPIEYETACKALEACCSIDEGKYWADKADALAAWARIYHERKIERQAKILKLRAYRRMGEIAREIAATRIKSGNSAAICGGRPVLKPILRQAALTETECKAALALSRLTIDKMTILESRKVVPSISSSYARERVDTCLASDAMSALSWLASAIKRTTPREFRDYADGRAYRGTNLHWRVLAAEIDDYLDILLRKE